MGRGLSDRIRRFVFAFACAVAVVGVASAQAFASCDTNTPASFSNSNPSIAINANNSDAWPLHIIVGGISWGKNGGSTSLGGGYYLQHYSTIGGLYSPPGPVSLEFTYPSNAGSCASQPINHSINITS